MHRINVVCEDNCLWISKPSHLSIYYWFVPIYKSLDAVIRGVECFSQTADFTSRKHESYLSVQLCLSLCLCVCLKNEFGSRWSASVGLLGQHFSIYGHFLPLLSLPLHPAFFSTFCPFLYLSFSFLPSALPLFPPTVLFLILFLLNLILFRGTTDLSQSRPPPCILSLILSFHPLLLFLFPVLTLFLKVFLGSWGCCSLWLASLHPPTPHPTRVLKWSPSWVLWFCNDTTFSKKETIGKKCDHHYDVRYNNHY